MVMFPRPGGQQELAGLLDLPLDGRRVTVVPEGIDLMQARAAHARAAHGRQPGPVLALADQIAAGPAHRVGLPLMVSAARLHPIKGLDRLVAAWLRDPRLRDGYNLVIAGGELHHGTVEEVRTLEAIRDVGRANGHPGDIPGLYLPGSMPNGDVAALLAAAALGFAPSIGSRGVYVCASAKEEFGLSIVEALAAGLPVVAPDRGGPRTYVVDGRTGILTDTTSIADLALATIRAAALWQDPERASMAAAQVASMGIDAMADRLTRVYRTVGSLHEAAG
jgi:glycosyltransferase involved in cell wall biosynthesis